MTLQILAVLVLGLMCGSELNLAVFGHPTLNRQPLDAHILVRPPGGSIRPGHAILDVGLDAAQPAPYISVGASKRNCVAPGGDRVAHSDRGGGLFPRCTGSHQHPHRALDSTDITERLEAAGTSLGCLSLAENVRTDRCVRAPCAQYRRSLDYSARSACIGSTEAARRAGTNAAAAADSRKRPVTVRITGGSMT